MDWEAERLNVYRGIEGEDKADKLVIEKEYQECQQ